MKIKYILPVLIAALVFTGCSKYGYVSLNYPLAPEAYLPDEVSSIAVVNRSLTSEEDEDGKLIEAITTAEVAGSDRLASDECIKGVSDGIIELKDAELVIPGKLRMYGTGTREVPELLDWDLVAEICDSEGADVLLVLETFDSNTDLLLSAATEQISSIIATGTLKPSAPGRVNMNVACYWRLYDPLTKRIPSRLYNWFARQVSGIKLHDFNCGLKAYRNQVVKSIEVYGDMHRYIPLLAKRAGFTKIGEKVVQHQKRKYGSTKYGIKRFIVGYLDLISIGFIGRFGRRPMHLFGTFGTLMFLVGFFAAAWLGGQKIYYTIHSIPMPRVTQSPYFFLALTAMIIGTQLFLAGFLGELITRNSTVRNEYLIDETINL